MSTSTSLRLSLVVLVVLAATVAQAAILTRAIEAQKSLVEREEQMLDQAKQQIQQKAQDAYDVSRGAVSSVADQLRYVVMYPWRMANEALEKPKLYAKYLLSKVPPVLSAEVTTPPPTTVALTEDTEPEVEPTSESNRLPLLVSSLQSLFNGDTTEDDLPQPNPYVEVIEIKYQGPKVVSSQTPEELLPLAETEDVEPTRDVLLA
ncbi:uncharacterized protein LOC131294176 [Anopheles ziemanni]|uniref:uncharacterized protein LOC131264887 n=1 Tax=Anopheles coustani TaxID=139045 RepID=UPI00265865B3|nr:uncharacterized protein LOC131264887 [Anopheles coustani]XP_058178204.1 uncharacterized protein LOC131294176 [Anopheles ziemanni]